MLLEIPFKPNEKVQAEGHRNRLTVTLVRLGTLHLALKAGIAVSLRLDRIATLCLASTWGKHTSLKSGKVPILMYHSIAREDEGEINPYYRIATDPHTFAIQMRLLHEWGYTACSLADIVRFAAFAQNDSRNKVILTFDDGYHNVYREAFPVLQRYGFKATVYLPTACVGDNPLSFNGRTTLTWSEVREMHKHGITIGSHTVSHPQLRSLNRGAIVEELVNSKATIEENISDRVSDFAYPYACPQTDKRFLTELQGLLQNAGYSTGVCTTLGRADARSNQYFLPRLPVNGADDTDLFHAKLTGCYDWMRWPQVATKSLQTLRA